ncbi:hypothetical protein [Spirosoma fluminis]
MNYSDRIDRQKEDDKSLLKAFVEDQLGILLTIFGALPLLSDSFRKNNAPPFLEDSLSTINFATILICGLIIIFVYGERQRFVGEKRLYASLFSLLLFTIGISMWVISIYLSQHNKVRQQVAAQNQSVSAPVSTRSASTTLVSPVNVLTQSPTSTTSLSTSVLSPKPNVYYIRYDYWVLIILFLVILFIGIYQILDRLFSLINTYDIKGLTLEEGLMKRSKHQDMPYSRVVVFKHLITKSRLNRFTLSLLGIVIVVYLLTIPLFKESIPKAEFTAETLMLIHILTYVGSYPFFLLGSIFLLIMMLVSYSRKRSFYQQIAGLSDQYYEPIENMVDSLVNFEVWFDQQEKILRSNMLSSNRQKDQKLYSEDEAKRLAQRTFIWKAIREKLSFYSNVVTLLASNHNRTLYAAGELIDKILLYMPDNPQDISEFKAVSHDDLYFWRKRGEEYLAWNRSMFLNKVQVERIFLFNSSQSLTYEGNIVFTENLQAIMRQIGLGINIGVCYMDNLKSYDGSQAEPYFDFGVYPNFAISFFEKPLHVGGRSLSMNFDENFIKKLTLHYDAIKRSCEDTYLSPAQSRIRKGESYIEWLDSYEKESFLLIMDFVDNFVKRFIGSEDQNSTPIEIHQSVKNAFEGWLAEYQRQITKEIREYIKDCSDSVEVNLLNNRIITNSFGFSAEESFKEFVRAKGIILPWERNN